VNFDNFGPIFPLDALTASPPEVIRSESKGLELAMTLREYSWILVGLLSDNSEESE
jgi:hypothetical protein